MFLARILRPPLHRLPSVNMPSNGWPSLPAFLLALGLPSAAPALAQSNVASLPFLADQFSIFDTGTPTAANRQFHFTLPSGPPAYPTLTAEITPTITVGNLAALNPTSDTLAQGLAPYTTSDGYWLSLAMASSPYIVPCNNSTTGGGGGVVLDSVTGMYISLQDNLQDEMANRVLPTYQIPSLSYTVKDLELDFKIQGGQFDGQTVPIRGELAFGSGLDTNNDPTIAEAWTGNMLILLDWGVDPLGNTNYLLVNLYFAANASTGDSSCLPLENVCQHFYGSSSVGAYFNPQWNALLAQTNNGQMYLQGAIPELLYLYDFSGSHTFAPGVTVPPQGLGYATVLDNTNAAYPGYTNIYQVINQYDAGYAVGLPNEDGGPGGNACGPTSLGMALRAHDIASVDLPTVYANTMSGTAFDDVRAQNWLQGQRTYAGVKFSASTPLTSGTQVSFRYVESASSPTGPGFAQSWRDVDSVLDTFEPVLVRTALGAGQGPGGGHMILLLGRGHNDDLAQLYQQGFGLHASGDYYVVADPAGCYYANYDGRHYADCLKLARENAGMNYGGWFAMYPKEMLQTNLYSTGYGIYFMAALTIGVPFHRPATTVTVHSPVAVVITDPIGRQSGVMPDGTSLLSIPLSYYERPLQDEEVSGASFDPNGAKSVELDEPMDGVYHIQLTGTNNGPFEIEQTLFDANGTMVQDATNFGAVTTGQLTNYTFTIQLGGRPSLQFQTPPGAIALFWPTNAAGFALQSSTNLGPPPGWTTIPGPFSQTNGVFAYTNVISRTPQFFRLKN